MPLIDTNILIYSGQVQFAPILATFVTDRNNFVSVISIVETLGFQRITPQQIIYFESIFKVLQITPIDNAVIEKAVEIRRLKKMSLGDALIAATAIVIDEPLITRNVIDFAGIDNLVVINPIP
jgi:predicted nucleic acid-binding protein